MELVLPMYNTHPYFSLKILGKKMCVIHSKIWCFLYSHFAESFGHKWVLDFIKSFFCIYGYDHVVFILHFVYVVNCIYWFAHVVPSLHSQNKSHLLMVYYLFDALLCPFCKYFIDDFSIYLHQGYWLITNFLVSSSGFRIRITRAL